MAQQIALHYVLEGSFCSFRDPVAAKYQPTFWLPPKTSVIGFLGAALGLEPPELEPVYDSLQIGAVLVSWGGFARDLWGYTKLKASRQPEASIVMREMIFRPRYAFYIVAMAKESQLAALQEALLDPAYPLRFGRGEDLAMFQGKPRLVELSPVDESPWLRWTLLPFTIEDRPCALEDMDKTPMPRMPPRSVRMPFRFRYGRDWVRQVESRWMTQVFDWGVRPSSAEGLWTDGKYTFYLI